MTSIVSKTLPVAAAVLATALVFAGRSVHADEKQNSQVVMFYYHVSGNGADNSAGQGLNFSATGGLADGLGPFGGNFYNVTSSKGLGYGAYAAGTIDALAKRLGATTLTFGGTDQNGANIYLNGTFAGSHDEAINFIQALSAQALKLNVSQ